MIPRLLLAATLALPARPAAAAGTGRAFEVEPWREGLLAAGMLTLAFAVDRASLAWDGTSPCAGERAISPPPSAACDPSAVSALDRWVVDQRSGAARSLSDVGVGALVVAPLVFPAVHALAASGGAPHLAADLATVATTLAATTLATNVLKVLVARPRPLTYAETWSVEDRHAADARLSFPSGHSSLSFAGASVLSVLLLERVGPRPAVFAGIASAYVAAAGVAAMRVAGGKHFLTDVLAGASLGTLVGLGIPLALRGPPSLELSVSPAALTIGGVF